MDGELSELIGEFYDYFLDLYHQGKTQPAAGPVPPAGSVPVRAATLAFEAIGTPMTADMFKLASGDFDAGIATQQFSLCANMVPLLSGITIEGPGLLTVDGIYDLVLSESAALPGTDADELNHLKRTAKEVFANAETSYSIAGAGGTFHPALPVPKDWPAPSAAEAWSHRSFEQRQQAELTAFAPATAAAHPVTQAAATPPPVVARPAMPNWGWRIAPPEVTHMLGENAQHVVAALPRPAPPPPPHPPLVHPMLFRPMLVNAAMVRQTMVARPPPPPALGQMHAPVPPHPIMNPSATSPSPVNIQARADLLRIQMQALAARSCQHDTTSQRLSLSFDYMLVQAERTWLSGELLASRDWCLPGMQAGDVASGSGTGKGTCEVLPVAALVVRNLVIEADWTADDMTALHGAVNFGPFSLLGRTIDTAASTLSCPGIQIIAWVLEPLPCLPPCPDPAVRGSATLGPAPGQPASVPAPPSLAPATTAPAPALQIAG